MRIFFTLLITDDKDHTFLVYSYIDYVQSLAVMLCEWKHKTITLQEGQESIKCYLRHGFIEKSKKTANEK